MAMITCPECSKDISNTAISCPNCGYQLKSTNVQYKIIKPGRGFGITSMIMGILSAVYGFITLGSVVEMSNSSSSDAYFASIIPITFAILALIFGIVSHYRGYRKGIQKTGVILGTITLILCIVFVCTAIIVD